MTLDEIIKEAFRQKAEDPKDDPEDFEKPFKNSLAFKLWERKFLRDLRKGKSDINWTLRKARRIIKTAAVCGTLAVFMTTACVVAPLTIGRFSFNDRRDYSELFLSNISSDKTIITEYYGLPEESGWTVDHIYKDELDLMVEYVKGEKFVTLEQSVIREYMGHVNTENAVVEPMSLYTENDGFLITWNDKIHRSLYWLFDGYLLSFAGNIDKNELINLALSTKVVNF